MILHLVTDRARLAPDADTRLAFDCLTLQARYAVDAGIDVIQVRELDLDGGPLARLVTLVVATTRGSGTRVVVNDRLDVALAAGADGVHLRGTSFDAARVRALVPAGFLIGRSVRSAEEAAAAGPVDYLVAGTVWATASKPAGQALLGREGLAAIVSATGVPVLAIGGVALRRTTDVAGAGAAGMAAIGAWIGDCGDCGAAPLDDLARAFRASFAANMSR